MNWSVLDHGRCMDGWSYIATEQVGIVDGE